MREASGRCGGSKWAASHSWALVCRLLCCGAGLPLPAGLRVPVHTMCPALQAATACSPQISRYAWTGPWRPRAEMCRSVHTTLHPGFHLSLADLRESNSPWVG